MRRFLIALLFGVGLVVVVVANAPAALAGLGRALGDMWPQTYVCLVALLVLVIGTWRVLKRLVKGGKSKE